MRVNGKAVDRRSGLSLSALAASHFSDADLALVDGVPVDRDAWDGVCPEEDADIILARRGVVPDPETYHALLVSRNQPGTVERLAAATVGVAGCGGLGSNAAMALARMGVGGLTLVDFDIVEPTNLNRQAYFAGDVGTPKVEALRRHIAGINPLVAIESRDMLLDADNAVAAFAGCDVILECLDRAEAKQMFVEAILSGLPDTPLVAASGLGGLGDGNAIATRAVMSRLWLVGDGESGVGPGMGLAAPRVLIAAGHQALCAARLILGMRD